MYKSVMLGQLEAKAKQLVKIERRISQHTTDRPRDDKSQQRYSGSSSVRLSSSYVPHDSGNVSMANGSLANGSLANGSLANGSLANGSLANGSLANSSLPNGFVPNGSLANNPNPNYSMINNSMANGTIQNQSLANNSIGNRTSTSQQRDSYINTSNQHPQFTVLPPLHDRLQNASYINNSHINNSHNNTSHMNYSHNSRHNMSHVNGSHLDHTDHPDRLDSRNRSSSSAHRSRSKQRPSRPPDPRANQRSSSAGAVRRHHTTSSEEHLHQQMSRDSRPPVNRYISDDSGLPRTDRRHIYDEKHNAADTSSHDSVLSASSTGSGIGINRKELRRPEPSTTYRVDQRMDQRHNPTIVVSDSDSELKNRTTDDAHDSQPVDQGYSTYRRRTDTYIQRPQYVQQQAQQTFKQQQRLSQPDLVVSQNSGYYQVQKKENMMGTELPPNNHTSRFHSESADFVDHRTYLPPQHHPQHQRNRSVDNILDARHYTSNPQETKGGPGSDPGPDPVQNDPRYTERTMSYRYVTDRNVSRGRSEAGPRMFRDKSPVHYENIPNRRTSGWSKAPSNPLGSILPNSVYTDSTRDANGVCTDVYTATDADGRKAVWRATEI